MKNIKMTSVVLAAVVAFGGVAQAGQLNLDARMDYVAFSANEDSGKPPYNAFQVTRLKLDYVGKLGELNSFRVRIDPLNNAAGATTRDKTSRFVDLAYLTRKFSDTISFSMGKVITGMGGIEATNNPGDIYQRSIAGNEVAAIYWPVGAQLDVGNSDHKAKITMANVTEDVTNGGSLNQTRSLAGLTYNGKLMDGLAVNASYHAENYMSTADRKLNNGYMAVGARFTTGDFQIEADMLQNSWGYDTKANNDKLSTASMVALLRYNIESFGSVHAKYENTSQKTATGVDTDTTTNISGLTAAVEYVPNPEEKWRMHTAYTQRSTKPEVGNTRTDTTIYVGMRLVADFMK